VRLDDELLAAVDVEGRAGDRGVRHEVDGERGNQLLTDFFAPAKN